MEVFMEKLYSLPIFKSSESTERHDSLGSAMPTYSLMTVHRDTVYIWHRIDQKLYCVDLKTSRDADSQLNFKTLLLTCAPYSAVHNVRVCAAGRRLALYGPGCITVVDLPSLSSASSAPSVSASASASAASSDWLTAPVDRSRDTASVTSNNNNNTTTLTCVSHHVAERFMLCTRDVCVVQAKWLPDPDHSALLACLFSDNHFRVYDVSEDVLTPCHVVAVGAARSSQQQQQQMTTTTTTLAGSCSAGAGFVGLLGGTAVAFDFGPPAVDNGKLYRPVYLLRGNGDILTLRLSVSFNNNNSNSNHGNSHSASRRLSHVLHGPLTMLPAADDNYGTDACDLLCLTESAPHHLLQPPPQPLHTRQHHHHHHQQHHHHHHQQHQQQGAVTVEGPTVLVIATPCRIYHCIVMSACDTQSNDNDHEEASVCGGGGGGGLLRNGGLVRSQWECGSESSCFTNGFSAEQADMYLHIYECVELKMALLSPAAHCCAQLVAPIRLHRDTASDFRYYCTHLYGAHCVSVPLVHALQRYYRLDDESDEPLGDHSAQVTHLLCTDSIASPPNPESTVSDALCDGEWRPVLGLAVVSPIIRMGGATSHATPTSQSKTPPTLQTPPTSALASYQSAPLLLLLLHNQSLAAVTCERRFLVELDHCQPVSTDSTVPSVGDPMVADTAIESHVRRLLNRTTSQPQLHSSTVSSSAVGASQPPLSQQLQLLTMSSCCLRSEYVLRQRAAVDWLSDRCTSLQQLYGEQQRQLQLLTSSQQQLRDRAQQQLAERYRQLLEAHKLLEKRVESVSAQVQSRVPVLSDAERQMARDVAGVSDSVRDSLTPAVQQVLTKYRYQKQLTEQASADRQKGGGGGGVGARLSDSQRRTVQQIVAKQGRHIGELVQLVQGAKSALHC